MATDGRGTRAGEVESAPTADRDARTEVDRHESAWQRNLIERYRGIDAHCGQAVHTVAACAACAALPIGAASSSITLVVLAVVFVLRFPILWQRSLVLLTIPTVIFGVAFAALAVAALMWSPDVPRGLSFLKTLRFLALLLLLWPVLDRVAWLVFATLIGVAIQNAIQVIGFLGMLPAPRWELWQSNGGLSRHAGHTGVWSAAAVLWHLAALWGGTPTGDRGARWRRHGPLLLLAAIGVAIGAGTAPMVGLICGLVTLLVILAVRGGRRKSWGPLIGAVAVVIAITTVALPTMRGEIRDAWSQLQMRFDDGPPSTSVGQRAVWWTASIRVFGNAPWFGAGTGGFRTVVAFDEPTLRAEEARRDRSTVPFVYHDPHNTVLLALVEQGLLGALLLIAWLAAATIQVARDRWDFPTAAAALPVLVVWLVAGSLESLQSSGMLMALGLLVMAITLRGRPAPTNPARCVAPTETDTKDRRLAC